jgi:NADH:ubiquinone oxidoreductase subunit E
MIPDTPPEHPDITPEMWTDINAVITANHRRPGAVITVLRECQNVVGYLPVELIDYISDGLDISSSEVFGVASFYKIKEGGTTEDRRFSLEGVRCLGACGLAPVMVVDHDTHGAISSDAVIDVLHKYE